MLDESELAKLNCRHSPQFSHTSGAIGTRNAISSTTLITRFLYNYFQFKAKSRAQVQYLPTAIAPILWPTVGQL